MTRAQVAKAASQNRQLLEAKRDRLNSLKADLTSAWKDQEDARHGVANTRQTVATNEEALASAPGPVPRRESPSAWTCSSPRWT